METKKNYNERRERLKKLGFTLKPFEEYNREVREMNKLARECGYPRGIDQVVEENKNGN